MENEVKEPAPKYNYISPEAYLAAERASESRSEYYDGHIITMTGAGFTHNVIVRNIIGNLFSFLKGKIICCLPAGYIIALRIEKIPSWYLWR